MKIALCVVVRYENLYLKEWIEYHKKLGFDNIIIYDNNHINEDTIDDVISDYVKSEYVILENKFFNKKKFYQPEIYNHCVDKYKYQFDWIAILDLDEFLCLENYSNIHDFINSNNNFKKCDTIVVQWLLYKDNGYLEVNSHNVLQNFDDINNCVLNHPLNNFKSFINCNNIIKKDVYLYFADAHKINDDNLILCNTQGDYIYGINGYEIPCYKNLYIKHFITKSLSEYIDIKLKRGLNWEIFTNSDNFDLYKMINDWSIEYDNYVQYKKNNQETNKKILICIFSELKSYQDIILETYIKTINEFDNIDYKIINSSVINFKSYYDVIKDIYDNNNIYDYVVIVNQQIYINIYLLNRFLNIIADQNTIYTNIFQMYLTNYDINERFCILSKIHFELILNNKILENPDSMDWYPSYVLSIVVGDNNIRVKSLGNINFDIHNILDFNINNDSSTIITWTNPKLTNPDNILKIKEAYNKLYTFIENNKSKFVLRLYPVNYGHQGKYVEFNNIQGPGYIYKIDKK